jgi:hypothetical protein
MERKRNPGSTGPATERTAPPSIRSAAPVVALPIHRLIPPRASRLTALRVLGTRPPTPLLLPWLPI